MSPREVIKYLSRCIGGIVIKTITITAEAASIQENNSLSWDKYPALDPAATMDQATSPYFAFRHNHGTKQITPQYQARKNKTFLKGYEGGWL